MTWRAWLLTSDVLVVLALAAADGWPVDSGWAAIVVVIIVLTPMVMWARTAPTPVLAWSVSALMLGVLLACLWTSRVPLSVGPAAPPVDWLLPYVAISVIICLAAMTACRSWAWQPATAIVALMVAASCCAGFLRLWEGEGSHNSYLPPTDVVPQSSGLEIADSGRIHCGNNGALCSRVVAVRTSFTVEEVRGIVGTGTGEPCRPVTGILSHLGLYRYGDRCVCVDRSARPGVVHISMLGREDWWVRSAVVPVGCRPRHSSRNDIDSVASRLSPWPAGPHGRRETPTG